MTTFREDLHLGHKTPLVDTNDIKDGAITTEKLGDGCVQTRHLADKSVTCRKLADGSVKTRHLADKSVTREKLANLSVGWQQLDGEVREIINDLKLDGSVMVQEFGNNPRAAISQKVLTEALQMVWGMLESIVGTSLGGFSIDVSPEGFIKGSNPTIRIKARHLNPAGVFERITFYINDEEVAHGFDVPELEYEGVLEDACTVTCVARIMGREYSGSKYIYAVDGVWIGGGDSADEVMELEPSSTLSGPHDIILDKAEKIWVIVPSIAEDEFIRMDMNGVEIACDKTRFVKDNVPYTAWSSRNTLAAGEYNIDINS